MKIKSVLYRNFSTLSDDEKLFVNSTDSLRRCDFSDCVYPSTELIWISENYERLSNKGWKIIEKNPHLQAVCPEYWNSIN